MRSTLVAAIVAVTAAVPTRADEKCKRANDSSFTQEQRQLIGAAQMHLESVHQGNADVCFDVGHGQNGNTFVIITRVAGYRDGKPYFQPGGHTVVEFDSHGKVIRLHAGA